MTDVPTCQRIQKKYRKIRSRTLFHLVITNFPTLKSYSRPNSLELNHIFTALQLITRWKKSCLCEVHFLFRKTLKSENFFFRSPPPLGLARSSSFSRCLIFQRPSRTTWAAGMRGLAWGKWRNASGLFLSFLLACALPPPLTVCSVCSLLLGGWLRGTRPKLRRKGLSWP